MPKIYSGGSPQNINLKDNQYNINVSVTTYQFYQAVA